MCMCVLPLSPSLSEGVEAPTSAHSVASSSVELHLFSAVGAQRRTADGSSVSAAGSAKGT